MNIKSEMLLKLKKQKSCDELEKTNFKKKEAANWFVHLRDEICRSFEKIENTPYKGTLLCDRYHQYIKQ